MLLRHEYSELSKFTYGIDRLKNPELVWLVVSVMIHCVMGVGVSSWYTAKSCSSIAHVIIQVVYDTLGEATKGGSVLSTTASQCLMPGNSVRVELSVDIFKVMQQGHGGWNDEMEKVITDKLLAHFLPFSLTH